MVQQVEERRDEHGPPFREPGAFPLHPYERLGNHDDRPGSGRPEEPLVVLRVAPRDRFVEGSGLIPEKLSADQERARVGLHPAPRHQIGEVEPIPRGYPRERAVPGLYEQAAGGHVGGRIAG